ncbi:hypothetical protein PhCBS80983_g03482 [Powellomyces hirtus]|uniref:GPI ethanolamine phosphate transferase 2 C-terminal domain-containing protein n=1 Tax=Powellomyces hirtus TaxID=109895 RepID=A0A507E457_9FUNG|nr:hypothetical protein PhCBS80983_g03482 [Powellomyces hirtus]
MKRRIATRRSPPGRSVAPTEPASEPAGVPLVTVNLAPVSIPTTFFGRLVIVLCLATIVQLAGLYLFGSGFLLTRLELSDRNNCTTYPRQFAGSSPPAATDGCWHEARYKRAVFVVLDALRFDFADYDEEVAAEAIRKGSNASVPYYINKLPVLRDVLRDEPGHGLLFRVRADPPTTTLQRLKALTTGTLPTFVDAGSNFFGQVIAEDNIIEQFTRAGKRVIFMGDDTWENMYPNVMNESYPYPSLVVWDLHTVDNGVLSHLQPFLKRDPEDWDLLIAHFLGVDHAGHRYGPAHPAMGEKLTQMNGVLHDLFKEVDEDTVVFVIGDHGMDPKGDHGGDSENEVNAGLFMYSKRPLIDKDPTYMTELESYLAAESKLDLGTNDPFVYLHNYRTTPQIDFVPTISLLLGIPIPFGNLGMVLPELFFVSTKEKSPGQNLLAATRANARQIDTYIREYSTQRMAAKLAISELGDLFESAEQSFADLGRNPTPEDVKTVYLEYVKFTRSALIAARKLWARFDVPLIVLGCVVMFLSLASLLVYTLFHWGSSQSPMYIVTAIGAGAGWIASYFGVLHAILLKFENTGDTALHKAHELVFGVTVGFMLSYLLTSLLQYYRSRETGPQLPGLRTVLGITIFLAHVATPASDNLTVFEDSYTTFLLQGFGVINFIWAFTVKVDKIQDQLVTYSSAFMVLTQLSHLSTICREEQHPHCIPSFYSSPHSSVAAPYTVLLLFLLIPLVVFVLSRVLKSSDNDQAIGKTIPTILLPMGLGAGAIYWTLDTLDNYHVAVHPRLNLAEMKYWWARIALMAISSSSLYVWANTPNCVGMDIVTTVTTRQGVMDQGGPKQQLCFMGIPNAVGGSYLVFLSVTYMILAMFQKPMGGIMMTIAFLQILCLLEMLHLWRDKSFGNNSGIMKPSRKERIQSMLGIQKSEPDVPPSGPLSTVDEVEAHIDGWTFFFMVPVYLLGSRHFFATGHQSTLSSIQWDIGYVGLKELNWTLSPLLVILNTFAGPLLCALAAPLVSIWKRPLIRGTEDRFGRELGKGVLVYLSMMLAATVSATLLAGHFRRHLMVWRVFAPKFFFSAMFLVLADVIVIVFGITAVFLPVRAYAGFLGKMKELGITR